MLLLGDTFPNFQANSTEGVINFYKWLGDSWGILFSHPADFTPVCTTELAKLVQLMPEFQKRNVKVIALSCDSVCSHWEWSKDIKFIAGASQEDKFPFPIIEDKKRAIAYRLGMIDQGELDSTDMPVTARAVFVVDPYKKYRLSLLYPASTGRNFDEILRVIDSLQLCDKNKVATPANWKIGDDVMVLPSVAETKGFNPPITVVDLPSGKRYFRKTKNPEDCNPDLDIMD
ncbi:peroxiredoxin-6 [Maniola jurtina]|uniref:peroxiredoxin-6 n=1 Tax=Maniola jurtina TaxID=191418 RepID=UPI001E68DBE3|nr:peroxiredoxin-6 [Maniola jurtina]